MIAASRGYRECVSVLVASGADVNKAKVRIEPRWSSHFYDQEGETALIMAAENGHYDCVSILIANGADANISSEVIAWKRLACLSPKASL